MYILGMNAFHADSAACLLQDGKLVAAAEEERFRRLKHWAGLPTEAVRYCLGEAGIDLGDIDHVAVNRDPRANLFAKALHGLRRRPSVHLVAERLRNAARIGGIGSQLPAALGQTTRARIHGIEHHRAHLASAFLVSPFQRAAVVSVDGFGDFVSTMWGTGCDNRLRISSQIGFPHSVGLFYQAMTQFLGFWNYGDEYKVMGLAAYGEASQAPLLRRIVAPSADGRFALDLDFFRHDAEGVEMVWDGGKPTVGRIFTNRLIELLGPPRAADEAITDRHRDLAASVQQVFEEVVFNLLGTVRRESGETALCLAGGCAMNSLANGKIFEETGFRDLYVPSAAGDAGGAIGAAMTVWCETLGEPRRYMMDRADLGPAFDERRLRQELDRRGPELRDGGCAVRLVTDEGDLCRLVAGIIADGGVVGWFQGRMEFGPRALGGRSILGDPRRPDMKEILNHRIKRRESFRPFAPSVLRDHVGAWFETDYGVPFMLQVFPIRAERRHQIPAVTHVDGTGRLQTVTAEQNPRYHRLIEAFRAITEVPMVLNTSFNENEPVVCKPAEALDCFLRTQMDALVLENFVVTRGTDRPMG
jgi:carbamoyltransferase